MKNSPFESIVTFEKEIAIKWKNGEASFLNLVVLRKACPCAWCSGEKDVFGNIYSGDKKKLPARAFVIDKFEVVGLYGVRFFWKDGHSDGIYVLENLKNLSINA
jgi:DUF971 family protein